MESPRHGWLGILVLLNLGLREFWDCWMLSLACASIHKGMCSNREFGSQNSSPGVWNPNFFFFLLQSLSMDLPKILPGDEIWLGILLPLRKFWGNYRICDFLLFSCPIHCSSRALEMGMWKGAAMNGFQSSPHLP